MNLCHTYSNRPLWPAMLMLAGATGAIFITGTQDVWAMVVFLALAGLGALVALPLQRAGWGPVVLGALYCGSAMLALLPLAWFATPTWRAGFPASDVAVLGASFAAMPAYVWFWWSLLAATFLAAWVLLTSPIEGRRLAVFLHAVAGVVAAYAVLSIVDAQSSWTYPFSGGAPFGFLPNRNHTATLLVVGAIASFGLMQWELTHGHRSAAAWAALCGAPPELRVKVLERWVTLPNAAAAAAYMEARSGGDDLALWRPLATYYAANGQPQRAVELAARVLGSPLDPAKLDSDFGRELAALQEQGNTVALRRLLREAGASANADQLEAAMAWSASEGDWAAAWKIASRLVVAKKTAKN